MAGNAAATPQAHALGAALRIARETAGHSQAELARQLGFSAAALSRWESGQRTPTVEDVASILGALGVTGTDRDQLLQLARDPDRPQWLSWGSSEQQRQLETLLRYESTATRIVNVSPLLVPGMLQTRDYARAIMRAAGVSASEIETRVSARMGRRDTLTRPQPAQLTALVGECALYQDIGGPEVMLEQLRYLAAVPSVVDLRIIPIRCPWHPGLEGSWVLVEGPEGSVVHMERRTSGLFLHDDEDVDAYRDAIEMVLRVAMSPEDSTQLIATAMKQAAERTAP